MKIIKLQAENVKKLRAVEITPTGSTVLISGRNNQGKTSVLDAIWLALGGAEAEKGMVRPIRDGETRAQVTLDLGEYTVTRTWTANDRSYLTVKNRDGSKFASPQALLDRLVGKLAFDPLAFARMSPREQRATLLHLIELPVDLDAVEAKRVELYAQRTAANREVKQREAALASRPVPDPSLPDAELSATALLADLQQAQEQQLANAALRGSLEDLRTQAKTAQADLAQLDAHLRELQARRERRQREYEEILARGKETAARVEQLVDPDMEPLRVQLTDLERRNAAIRDAQKYRALQAELAQAQATSDQLTAALTDIERTKAEALQTATFPVEGLSFSDSGVVFQGIPLQQCSSSEQLRVSLAMAMALNPQLRVIRITDGSLLDKASLVLFEEMAQERDYQLWIEMVDDSGTVGIQIEDGMVKGASTPPHRMSPPPAPSDKRSVAASPITTPLPK
ncbi:MAG: AAA family ATPase [Candidatus Rokubacteria bacterium]|nr:AAA family ATPase [Candidatus Rokubacteria bacterium]